MGNFAATLLLHSSAASSTAVLLSSRSGKPLSSAVSSFGLACFRVSALVEQSWAQGMALCGLRPAFVQCGCFTCFSGSVRFGCGFRSCLVDGFVRLSRRIRRVVVTLLLLGSLSTTLLSTYISHHNYPGGYAMAELHRLYNSTEPRLLLHCVEPCLTLVQ
jgi:hypothetical protein